MTHAPRQGAPGARYVYNDFLGPVVLTADDQGVVPIKSAQEARVADLLGLPPAKPKAQPKETD